MKVVIRVDASLTMGSGHVMRCLTLADALKEKGAYVEFICREHKGHLIDFIDAKGFKTHQLLMAENDLGTHEDARLKSNKNLDHADWLGATQQQDADACKVILKKISPDWLIVDHYAIDETWQKELQGTYKKLMVIDDLADRKHLCDLLLDQTYGRQQQGYQHLVPDNCQMLLGSQYALLRPEFAQWREYSLKRREIPEFKKLLITMGGVDQNNVTGRVLEELKNCDLPLDLEVTVIMGATAPHVEVVKQQVKKLPYKTEVKLNVSNMAEIMANADLAIGAAGATSWERCCLGLASIQIVLAENQKIAAHNLKRMQAVWSVSLHEDVALNLQCVFSSLKNGEGSLEKVSDEARKVTSGIGCQLVIEKVVGVKIC